MPTATQKHKVVISHDQTTHASSVTIDGREIVGVRRCDVALRAHDCEIVLVMGDEVDVVIEADTALITTKKEGADPSGSTAATERK